MPDLMRSGPSGFINELQNQSAGGYLSGFYLQQRMLGGDPFQIAFA